MRGLRRPNRRRLSALLFVALLLVPLVFSGHRHANEVAPASGCATCVAVHHVPAISGPVVAHVTPLLVALRLHGTDSAALPGDARPVALGRAPPSSSIALLA
jgi:hypothetical protein